jgi:transcriptional regulator with PAS, ATPase and Fis domain
MAQNGTIFLDEIGIPLHLQSKLLQIIQTKMVTIRESKARPLNVHITATNLNLKQVTDKNFREDLYYRINTMEIVCLHCANESKIKLWHIFDQKIWT